MKQQQRQRKSKVGDYGGTSLASKVAGSNQKPKDWQDDMLTV
jgi:hypothetical protein